MPEKTKDKKNNGYKGLPAGYNRVNAAESQAWFKTEEGALLVGELLGRYARKGEDQDGFYYQIKVDRPCMAVVPNEDGKDWGIKEVPEGTIVNVDERSALEGLATLCSETSRRFNVSIYCEEQVKIRGKRTFWKMEVGSKAL